MDRIRMADLKEVITLDRDADTWNNHGKRDITPKVKERPTIKLIMIQTGTPCEYFSASKKIKNSARRSWCHLQIK